MATTEIEKLERRYAENPQGLTFAPLAEVHRKNGDIPRALELLRTGLELHPNYIPASIVLGRCLWAQGDLPAAEAAFSHVLRLDDENVIALKSLAEISEGLGKGNEAQRWLKRLISIDRSNEEARQHLARLEAARGEPAPPADPPPAAPAAPVAMHQAPSSPTPLDLTTAIAEPATSPSLENTRDESASPAPALDFLDTSEATKQTVEPVTDSAAKSDSLVEDDRPAADQSTAPVDGLISQEFVPPKDTGYRLHPELTQEFEPGPDAPERVDESPEILEVETAEELELQSSGASEFRVPNAAEDFMESVRFEAEAMAEPLKPASAPNPPAPQPIKSAVEPIKPAPEPVKPAPEPITSAPEPPRRSYSAQVTKGQSVASFFQALLAARPPGSEKAGTALTDQPAQKQNASQIPPAGPASPEAAVSFDDFFGAPAGGSNAPNKNSDAGKDDLDQFQSWLQNLKR
jgi:tetratricopeptide (TPR) repeat protein